MRIAPIRVFGGLLAALLAAAPVAQAQLAREDSDLIVQTIARYAHRYPVAQTGDTHFGRLRAGKTTEFTIEVDTRKAYLLIGACDTACPKLTLAAANAEDGASVGQNEIDDRTSWLMVTPLQASKVRVAVACGESPCSWGVGVLAETQ